MLVLPEEDFAKLEERTPADLEVVDRQPRFLMPDRHVLIVGRKLSVAQRPRDSAAGYHR